ncbi:MAG TPA: DUF488 domain-containing protein [Thermoanaerobaculia bacterium]|nr:DUF488 domain-containing protein [Thermoanaerobaculia bacterium]
MLNRIYTIGHSTRTLEEFVSLLREHGVARLADIRRYPGSRRYPHFSGESLEQTLPQHGIGYAHFDVLGGRRKPAKDSRNAAWENEQFRGYADHMATPEFQRGVDALLQSDAATAVMCAEAVPWRCHRNLLADELVRREIEVLHIVSPGKSQPHVLSRMARIEDGLVIYPPPQRTIF